MFIRGAGHQLKQQYDRLPLHLVLAALVAIHGYILLSSALPTVYALMASPSINWLNAQNVHEFLDSKDLAGIPPVMIGIGLGVSTIGLALRARTAWFMALFLLFSNFIYDLINVSTVEHFTGYTLFLIILLIVTGRRFSQSSVVSGTLFAALGVSLLLVYAMIGTLYLGNEFTPPIADITDAFYFSIVAMSTVGFGDITPNSVSSRLFTTSIIVLGITVFATSISAVIGPIIRGRFQHLIKDKLKKSMKKNHIIIIGGTSLAQSVYAILHKSGHEIVVILPEDMEITYPEGTDMIRGDATDAAVLTQANAAQATYILALRADDSENAFIVLAAKEVGGEKTRTVALVNNTIHLNKVKQVNPDVILSLQALGAEILSRLVTQEPITEDLITKLLFPLDDKKPKTT